MTYRQSAPGVRLRFRRRERVPPLYGPPTVMQHMLQQRLRNYERQMENLKARTFAFFSGTKWPADMKILRPDERPETLRINRIKP